MSVLWFLLLLVGLFVVALFVLYDVIFSNNKRYMTDERSIPKGEQYAPYHEKITTCVDAVLAIPYETVEIKAEDGCVLFGKYYALEQDAPLVIFFHGYRCSSLRDGNGILLYTRKLGYNVLLVDQRAHGNSGGKTITFGIKERFDCKKWVEYALERFGENKQIYLSGLSMGAATVLMASDMDLPENVIGVLADCPYSSPKAILCSVMKSMSFSPELTYPLARLSAKWIGGFDMEETSAIEAVRRSKIPTLIIHGDDDRFVPCSMSVDCQMAGAGHVELVLIKDAGHGMCHCVDTPSYEAALLQFFQRTQCVTNR